MLLASIFINHLAAQKLAQLRVTNPSGGRNLVRLIVGANLLTLAIWKYAGFLTAQTSSVLDAVGTNNQLTVQLALPIAISFYTFQCISYVVDSWRGTANPAPRILDFAAYILLFPHLIAGPIVRYADIENDLLSRSQRRLNDFAMGAPRFFWGLAKKVLVADQVAAIANATFALPDNRMTTAAAWIGVVAYAIQIYFDFSGYSDMAIGLARMFGFVFPENFNRPYTARSITDFRRRWHISLSSWFRDYVYIPLGGNRRGNTRTYFNIAFVFLLTGFWHGANWTFIAWGIFHGACVIGERLTGIGASDSPRAIAFRRAATFGLVCIGWAMFRSDDISQAANIISSMLIPNGWSLPATVNEVMTTQRLIWFAIGLLAVVGPSRLRLGRSISETATPRNDLLRVAVMLTLAPIACIYAMSSTFSPFLYFKF